MRLNLHHSARIAHQHSLFCEADAGMQEYDLLIDCDISKAYSQGVLAEFGLAVAAYTRQQNDCCYRAALQASSRQLASRNVSLECVYTASSN